MKIGSFSKATGLSVRSFDNGSDGHVMCGVMVFASVQLLQAMFRSRMFWR